MTPTLRHSLIAASIATLAATGLLAGCEKTTTTTQAPDGTSTTTTTVTSQPSPSTERMKAEAKEVGEDMKQAADKAGKALEDGALTAKVKTALLADPDVKGLQIDVDTRNGVVTLSGSVQRSMIERAGQIARGTEGVKSVDNRLVAKAA